MTNPYGPWATAIDAGRNPQLSAFWRQWLTMLVPTSQTSPVLSRRSIALLIATATGVFLLPTLRPAPILAQQQPASDRATQAGAATPKVVNADAISSPSDEWIYPMTGMPFDLAFIGAAPVDVKSVEPTSGLPWDLVSWARDDVRLTEDQKRKLPWGKKTEEAAKAATDVLTPEQIARLKQLALQAKGPCALTTPSVASALGITEQQRTPLADLESRFQPRLKLIYDRQRAVMYSRSLSLQDIQAQCGELDKERGKLAAQWNEAALAVLTPQQRAKFASMKGLAWGAVSEAKSRAGGLRIRRGFQFMSGLDQNISGLVWSNFWRQRLPLSKDQEIAVQSLDDVLQSAGDHAAAAVAEKIEGVVSVAEKTKQDPPDWHFEDVARFSARFLLAEHHAERMVLGLLTEQQAKVVTRVRPDAEHPFNSMKYDGRVQERLGFTAYQKQELEGIQEEAGHLEPPFFFHPGPYESPESKSGSASTDSRKDRTDQEAEEFRNKGALKILTPSQRQIWNQITAEPEPPKPEKPDYHAPTAEQAAQINISAESAVFRVLAGKPDAFGLSEPQKQFLRKLEAIVREGLYWISLRTPKGATPSADVSQAKEDFVHDADQVVLLGILNEQQAGSVADTITSATGK